MVNIKFECDTCDAYGHISILNDSSEYYAITSCPACGAEIDVDDSDDE